MTNSEISDRIQSELGALGTADQEQVLRFVQLLRKRPGNQAARFSDLQEHYGAISTSDADLMLETIEAGCEQVDRNEW